MRNVTLIARRELQAYLRTMSGYVIIAVMLFIDGLLFNAYAVPGTAKKSSEVLADFFLLTSGITMVGAVFLSMRLIAEERQTGTISLLYSSPVHDLEIVIGKFLASLGFLCLFFLATGYMPALVAVYGKVSLGHIFAGYFGLVLVGACSLAIGTFGSSLTRSQVVAAVLSGVMCLALTTAWLLGKVTDRPLTRSARAWCT
jgi:ABC-2 type transport system permease protein